MTGARRWRRRLAAPVLTVAAWTVAVPPLPGGAAPVPAGSAPVPTVRYADQAAPVGPTVWLPAQTGGGAGGGGQSDPAAPIATGGLELVTQTALLAPDGTFNARIALGAVAARAEELEVAVTVYSVLDDESGLSAAPSRPINQLEPVPLAGLAVDAAGVLSLDMPVRSGAPFDELDRVLLPDAGVYPMVVELRDSDNQTVASLRLDLIRLPQPAAAGDTGSATGGADDSQGEGTAATRALGLVLGVGGPGGMTVEEAAGLLEAHPDAPVTLFLAPGMLAELRADVALARRLAEAAGSHPVVAPVEPLVDPSALAAIDQGQLYLQAAASTAAGLTALGLTPATDVAVAAAPVTTAGAELLAAAGIAVVFDLAPPEPGSDSGSGRAGRLATPGGGLVVVTLDDGGRDAAVSPVPSRAGPPTSAVQGPVVSLAHRQLARLMIAPPGRPPRLLGGSGPSTGVSGTGSGAVDLPSAGDPDGTDPGTTTGIAAGSARTVYADPVVLDVLLDAIGRTDTDTDGAPLTLLPVVEAARGQATETFAGAAEPGQDLGPVADRLAAVQGLLVTYDSFHVSGDNPPDAYRARLASALGIGQTEELRTTTVEAVEQELLADFASISLPGNQSVTLAARRGVIPLTIDNTSSGPRDVLLSFGSDKIEVVEDGKVMTVPPGVSSIDVTVEARSLGQSPLQVTLLTPDGSRLLSTSRFRVRSTAVPGLGLAISAVGLAGLAVWWYLSIKKRRAGRLQAGAGGRPPEGRPPGVGPVDRTRTLVGDSVEP